MAKTKLDDFQKKKPKDILDGRVWCSKCCHVVPDALVCLWCGEEIRID